MLWVFSGIIFVVWVGYSMQSKNVASQLLRSNKKIIVSDNSEYISFTPALAYKNVFIFFPGALVDPHAYVPLCRKLAENGMQTLVVKMPFRQAGMGYKKPLALGLLNDKNKTYILAGHSQGAKMAAQFVQENPGRIHQLILMATTHPKDYKKIAPLVSIMKIYAMNDGIAKPEDVIKNKPNLPADTKYVVIAGGNHSQFGYYGFQIGDHVASISREQQQDLILKSVLSFINQ